MSISASLQKAAKLQEKIDALREQLHELLSQARQELASTPAAKVPATLRRAGKTPAGQPAATVKTPARGTRTAGKGVAATTAKAPAAKPRDSAGSVKGKAGGRRSSLAGRRRAASPSGPLAPAVVKILEANGGKPMRVAEILAGLLENGYTFNAAEPKKNLAARIYRLSGVRQIAQGLFATV